MANFAHSFIMFDDGGAMRAPDLTRREYAAGGATSNATFDFPRFQIVNAGWVGIYQSGEKIVAFLRPSKVTPKAMGGALYHLTDAGIVADGPGSIVVLGADKPMTFSFPTRRALVKAICTVVAAAQAPNTDRFVRRLARRSDMQEGSPILGLATIWNELDGKFDMERLWKCLTGELRKRFVVVSTDPDAMHVKSFGDGFGELSGYWPHSGKGVRLRDQPDFYYGRWLECAYRQADHSNQPLIEAVDCDIDWPREGRRRHRYWRFIAPFQLDSGKRVVLGATLIDERVSLRPGRGISGYA